jgi:hypothetical protein
MFAQFRGPDGFRSDEYSSVSTSSFLHQYCSLLLVGFESRVWMLIYNIPKPILIEREAVMQPIVTSLLDHGTPLSSIIIKLSNYTMEPAHVQAPWLIPIQARIDQLLHCLQQVHRLR